MEFAAHHHDVWQSYRGDGIRQGAERTLYWTEISTHGFPCDKKLHSRQETKDQFEDDLEKDGMRGSPGTHLAKSEARDTS